MFKQESDSEKEGKGRPSRRRVEERESARKATIKLSFVGPLLPRAGWLVRALPPLTLTPSVACPLPCFYAHVAPPLPAPRDLHAQKEEGEKKNRLSAPSPSLMPPSHFHKYYF